MQQSEAHEPFDFSRTDHAVFADVEDFKSASDEGFAYLCEQVRVRLTRRYIV